MDQIGRAGLLASQCRGCISKLDGQELLLESALESVVGNGIGTILSCIPGKLAYFEGEDESLPLAR